MPTIQWLVTLTDGMLEAYKHDPEAFVATYRKSVARQVAKGTTAKVSLANQAGVQLRSFDVEGKAAAT
jgi:hypothetical protein